MIDEGLQQRNRVPILLEPIPAYPAADKAQNMAGEIPNLDPWEDQEASVVRHPLQALEALLPIPADELVSRLRGPRRRTEQEATQRAASPVPYQILLVLTHATAMTEVVVLVEQAAEEIEIRASRLNNSHMQWSQISQRDLDRVGLMSHSWSFAVAKFIVRWPPRSGERDQSTTVQLAQESPASHLLRMTTGGAPAPEFAQLFRETCTPPAGVLGQKSSDEFEVGDPNRPALDDPVRFHPREDTGLRLPSPGKFSSSLLARRPVYP